MTDALVERWYVGADSKVYGPFDHATISQMVTAGQVTADDFFAREGATTWVAGTDDPQLGVLFRRKLDIRARRTSETPTERQSQQRRYTTTKLALLAGIFLPIIWIVWPYYAAFRLMEAVRDGDQAALEQRVDWESLRQSLRGDLAAQILQNLKKNSGSKDSAFAVGFATLLGPAVVNQLIDSYVTPQAVATVRTSERNPQSSNKNDNSSGFAKSVDLARQVRWEQIQYAFFSGGPFAFRIDLLPPNTPSLRSPVGLEFAWNGDWRLRRIILPPEVFDTQTSAAPVSAANEQIDGLVTTKSSAPLVVEPSPIDIALRSKSFRAADYKANNFQSVIVLQLAITNNSKKDIRAFDGVLTFTDLLDNDIHSTKLAINESLKAGMSVDWNGSVDFNQFMDDHRRLRDESQSNIKTKFAVRKILYTDGTSKEYR